VNYIIGYPYTRSPHIRFFEGMKTRIGDIRRLGGL
jgi:hypothetical protein